MSLDLCLPTSGSMQARQVDASPGVTGGHAWPEIQTLRSLQDMLLSQGALAFFSHSGELRLPKKVLLAVGVAFASCLSSWLEMDINM